MWHQNLIAAKLILLVSCNALLEISKNILNLLLPSTKQGLPSCRKASRVLHVEIFLAVIFVQIETVFFFLSFCSLFYAFIVLFSELIFLCRKNQMWNHADCIRKKANQIKSYDLIPLFWSKSGLTKEIYPYPLLIALLTSTLLLCF